MRYDPLVYRKGINVMIDLAASRKIGKLRRQELAAVAYQGRPGVAGTLRAVRGANLEQAVSRRWRAHPVVTRAD